MSASPPMPSYVTSKDRVDLQQDSFTREVITGLSQPSKSIACKFLYDRRGSLLFDQICDLPEYYPTRTELGIMRHHAQEMSTCIGSHAVLLELGSGSSLKTRLLLDQLHHPLAYLPVDISRTHLMASAEKLQREYPSLAVHPIVADFTKPISLPDQYVNRPLSIYFPGSTIGNLLPHEASSLLANCQRLGGCRGKLLIGFDLQKDVGLLERAYNDSRGVTAEFNLNLLHRINRESEANFRVHRFRHVAQFNAQANRIEISIESRCDQSVQISGHEIRFESGERIHTEYSHKYTVPGFCQMALDAGLRMQKVWVDEQSLFAVMLLNTHENEGDHS